MAAAAGGGAGRPVAAPALMLAAAAALGFRECRGRRGGGSPGAGAVTGEPWAGRRLGWRPAKRRSRGLRGSGRVLGPWPLAGRSGLLGAPAVGAAPVRLGESSCGGNTLSPARPTLAPDCRGAWLAVTRFKRSPRRSCFKTYVSLASLDDIPPLDLRAAATVVVGAAAAESP